MKSTRKAKVLVVEDNQESRDLLVYFLKPAGYEVVIAEDGVEALEYINRELPDVILLDAMMPRMNGYQVCERLKKDRRTFHIPIIMITALKELKDKIQALEAGADDFISKPFDSVELLTRVKSLLRIKTFYDELIQRNRELEEQKQRLEQEDQLKKELTHLITHDMKSPLFVIQGNIQMMHMLREKGEHVESNKYVKRIERSSKGLLRMILNLIDISRLEQNSMDLSLCATAIDQLVDSILPYYLDMPENNTKRVEKHFNANLPKVYVDQEIFERVLDNLFTYVFKNTPDNSVVHIGAESTDNDLVLLKVYHQGRHIPEEFHEKVFTKFAQQEMKEAGFKPARALGLIFCRLALEANRGTIQIDPGYTEGTGFIVKLPTWNSSSKEAMESRDAVKAR